MLTTWVLAAALAPGSADPGPGRGCPSDDGAPARVEEIDTPWFRIPVTLSPDRRSRVQKVLLFVSTDHGGTWRPGGQITPDAGRFEFRAPQPGEYWFTPVMVMTDGTYEPSDLIDVAPQLKVKVTAGADPYPGLPSGTPPPVVFPGGTFTVVGPSARIEPAATARAVQLADEVAKLDEELTRLELDLIRKELTRLSQTKQPTTRTLNQIDRLRQRLDVIAARARDSQLSPDPVGQYRGQPFRLELPPPLITPTPDVNAPLPTVIPMPDLPAIPVAPGSSPPPCVAPPPRSPGPRR